MKFYSNKPSFPDVKLYQNLVGSIFESGFLTNFGHYHKCLLDQLKKALQSENLALCNNATTALACVIRSIAIEKKTNVITTPFTFSATCHSISWAGKNPVFVDIEDQSFNLCPDAVEASIDDDTAAIVPVHCYGFPCRLERFREISYKYNIPVIYDAAHTFGVRYRGQSLVTEGAASVVSTHATKAFNTAEGAIVFFENESLQKYFTNMTNFGIDENGETSFLGLNGKLSELHAALGLLNLRSFSQNTQQRKKLWDAYNQAFRCDSRLFVIDIDESLEFNYGYYPLTILDPKIDIARTIHELAGQDIIVRKYFSPILNLTPAFQKAQIVGNLKNAEKLNNSVLCLPIHEDYLPHAQYIVEKVKSSLNL